MKNWFKKICIDFSGTHIEKIEGSFPEGTLVFNLPIKENKLLVTIVVALKFIGIKYATFTQHIGII